MAVAGVDCFLARPLSRLGDLFREVAADFGEIPKLNVAILAIDAHDDGVRRAFAQKFENFSLQPAIVQGLESEEPNFRATIEHAGHGVSLVAISHALTNDVVGEQNSAAFACRDATDGRNVQVGTRASCGTSSVNDGTELCHDVIGITVSDFANAEIAHG